MMASVRTVIGLVLVLLLAALAACAGGASSNDGQLKTIVVWDRAGAQATIKQKWFETWNAGPGKEAGIQVRYEPQAVDKYEELVRVAFQTKRGPDVFHTPSAQLGGFVAAGWVQPLTDVVDASVLESAKPYLGTTSELVWGGEPYAIPTTAFTNRLLINRALFTKAGLDPDTPPKTLSELTAAAKSIAAVSPGKTYGFAVPAKWVGFRQWIVDLPIMAADADLTNGLFDQVTGKYDQTAYAATVGAYRAMVADKSAYPGSATLDLDAATAAFAKGEIGMMINSSAAVATLTQLKATADIIAAPLPVPDGTTMVRSPMNAGYPYGISATTAEPEAAGTVISALASAEIQEALAAGNAAPLSDAAWQSATVQKNKLLLQFKPNQTDQQWPKNPNSVVPVEGPSLDQTIVKLVIDPSVPIESTLSDLQSRYQTAFQKAADDGDLNPKDFTR